MVQKQSSSLTHKLSPWLRHHPDCARAIDHPGCICGLDDTLAALASQEVTDDR